MEMALLAVARPHVRAVGGAVDQIDRAFAAHELGMLARDRSVVDDEVVADDPSNRQTALSDAELDGRALEEDREHRFLAQRRTCEQHGGALELPHHLVELDLVLLAAQRKLADAAGLRLR